MEKKKLGLSNKSKLELSKTVEGGTVKQSFSHGRVKSVAVEVKKVRTFKKNENSSSSLYKEEQLKTVDIKSDSISEKSLKKVLNEDIKSTDLNNIETDKERLQKIKDAAHSDRIQRENKMSSSEQASFDDKNIRIKQTEQEKNGQIELEKKQKIFSEKTISQTIPGNIKDKKEEEKTKKISAKKNRADLKKQLSLGKTNVRRQAGKITIQQAYDDEERQRSLASIRRAR